MALSFCKLDLFFAKKQTGNTKGGSITLPLTSCLIGLESAVWLLTIFVFLCKTDKSKPVKQEINGTVIVPPLAFPEANIANSYKMWETLCQNSFMISTPGLVLFVHGTADFSCPCAVGFTWTKGCRILTTLMAALRVRLTDDCIKRYYKESMTIHHSIGGSACHC
jgi:hypothetical protein